MSIEQKIKEKDLLGLWRQLKSQRQAFLQMRDSLTTLINEIKNISDFATLADTAEQLILTELEKKINLIK